MAENVRRRMPLSGAQGEPGPPGGARIMVELAAAAPPPMTSSSGPALFLILWMQDSTYSGADSGVRSRRLNQREENENVVKISRQ